MGERKPISEAVLEFRHALAMHGIEMSGVALANPQDGDRLMMCMSAETGGYTFAARSSGLATNEMRINGIKFEWPDAGYLDSDGKLKRPGVDRHDG